MATQKFILHSMNDDQSVLVDHEMIMGRDQACAIVLSQGQASRQHAKITPLNDGLRVEDLKSTNGTLVKGEKIAEPTLLIAGDELRIGKQVFVVKPAEDETTIDSDATMLFGSEGATPSSKVSPETAPEIPAAPDEAVKKEAVLTKAKNKGDAKDKVNLADSNAPPSWVLSNQQAVDGTKFIAKGDLQEALQHSAGPVSEKVNVPTLIGSSEPILGMRFQLAGSNAKQWEIGRSTNCQVMINHDSVSSNHAQILIEGDHWKLIDMMSANGTYVNTKKGLSSYLSSGDVLRFGHVECTFLLPEGAQKSNAKSKTAAKIPEEKSAIKTALTAFLITGVLAAAVIVAISFWS